MKKIALISLMLATSVAFAQKVKYSHEEKRMMDDDYFEQSYSGFSTKKPAQIILKDGREVQGTITNVDMKKSIFTAIYLKNENTGAKEKIEAADIDKMYLPVSNMEKGIRTADFFTKVNSMKNKDILATTNKKDSYYKSVKVLIKNKKLENTYLLQQLNPNFSQFIEVYSDPTANETGGFSINGSPQLGGGVTKSYYVLKNGKAFWLQKKDFEENYEALFGDNAEFMKNYPVNSVDWNQFSFLVLRYTEMSSVN